jgi:hypothetical protein
VKFSDHPQVTKEFLSFRVSWPAPVCHRILVVETTLPLSEKQDGYDYAQLEAFVEFVGGHMEEVGAEKAEIFSTDGAWCIELDNPALKRS